MAIDRSPRSVADATRFTSNTPHANTKPTNSTTPASNPAPSVKASASGSRAVPGRPVVMPPAGGVEPETLDERVRRLRAAHLAARNHDVSRLDRVINASRRYLDAAHRFSITGLIGFSGLALLVTAYATIDMMIHNSKRRAEFFTLQQQLQTDSLEAARLAYMSGKATEDQIALVEEATATAKQTGVAMPALLGSPQTPAAAGGSEFRELGGASGAERSWGVGEALTESSMSGAMEDEEAKPKKSIKDWLFGGLKKEDTAAGAVSDELSFGEAEAEAGASGQARRTAKTVEEQRILLKEKAKAAFDTERLNQRRGGPLDQVGLEGGGSKKPTTSGWW